jgi:hypothetical protein
LPQDQGLTGAGKLTGPRYGEDLMTELGYYRFTVKQGARSHFWIAAEPAGITIKSLDDCVLGFDLGPQATHGDAKAMLHMVSQCVMTCKSYLQNGEDN